MMPRQCSQEHSYVPDMWRRICKPDVLIYLDAGLATIRRRRQISWGLSYLQVLNDRLRDARAHSDLVIRTDDMTPTKFCSTCYVFCNISSGRQPAVNRTRAKAARPVS